ncbi:MAG: hypothetical protein RMK15_05980 [Chloroflexota bacterium]|nr:hypothetical protein [Dehalococcoidia bacterium]MDW8046813.1 hypothetical protein [Chloroflexota bacterium]
MRRVAVVAASCSRAGARYTESQEDLLVEAGLAALAMAGVEPEDIDAAWFGCTTVSANHALLNFSLKLGYLPMTKVSNAGATGADAFIRAALAVASGEADVALVAGVEKRTDAGLADGLESDRVFSPAATGIEAMLRDLHPATFTSLYLRRYGAAFGLSLEEIGEALDALARRSRLRGALTPWSAIYGLEAGYSEDAGPVVAPPLRLGHCAPAFDGAAALVVTAEAWARQRGMPYAVLEGFGMVSGALEGRYSRRYAYVGLPELRTAAARAFSEAGVDGWEAVDHVQIFDRTVGDELLAYEDLGLVPEGRAVAAVLDGMFGVEARLQVNTDGGLLCSGFQAGASGVRQIAEAFVQLTGRAGPRQLPHVRRSVVATVGGTLGAATAVVSVFRSGA